MFPILLLDRVIELPYHEQARILLAVEHGPVTRVGGSEPVEGDARLPGRAPPALI